MARLNADEVTVLKGVHEHKSLEEIAQDINKSVAWAYQLARDMEAIGYVIQNKPRAARSRELTQAGVEYLRANGLLPITIRDIFGVR